jgi:hypothetical protein
MIERKYMLTVAILCQRNFSIDGNKICRQIFTPKRYRIALSEVPPRYLDVP